jgi:hypothetical protein
MILILIPILAEISSGSTGSLFRGAGLPADNIYRVFSKKEPSSFFFPARKSAVT